MRKVTTGVIVSASLTLGVAGAGLGLLSKPADASQDSTEMRESQSRFAVVNVYDLLLKGLRRPEIIERQQTINSEAQALVQARQQQELAPLVNELQSLQAQLQQAQQAGQLNTPQAQQQLARLQQLNQQGMQAEQRIQQEVLRNAEAQQAAITMEVYQEINGAVQQMAEESGYDWVFVSADPDVLQQGENYGNLVQELLGRPVMVHPDASDITEAVREVLGFPEQVDEDADGEMPGGGEEGGGGIPGTGEGGGSDGGSGGGSGGG